MDWLICTRTLVDVVESGSFAAAARRQGTNSPAISKRVQWLERELGVQLLKRSTRRLALTEAGERFYQQGRLQLGQWQSLIEETASLHREPQGILHIGASPALGSRIMFDVIERFMAAYPGFKVQLSSVESGQLPDLGLDLFISRELPGFNSAQFRSKTLFSYSGELFASPGYLASHPPVICTADLAQHSFLNWGEQLERAVQFAGEPEVTVLRGVLASNNPEALVLGAIQGMGLILTSSQMLRRELLRGDLVPVCPTLRSEVFRVVAYYPKLEFTHTRIQLFLDFLQQEFVPHKNDS